MRKDTVTTKVYPFDELSDDAKQSAIESLADINVDYEWWDSIFDDAKQIGLELTEFDICREAFCRGHFIEDADNIAKSILKDHGDMCKTYTTAKNFLDEYQEAEAGFITDLDAMSANEEPTYEEFKDTGLYDDLMNEFLRSILEDYRMILQKEYEYLTSKEVIIETIKANEYEFTVDGKLYG